MHERIGGTAGLKRRAKNLDFIDGGLDFDLDAIAIMVMIVGAIVLLFVLGGPIVLLGIDLIWMLGAFLVSTFARFCLGHPWRVDAVVGDERAAWNVQGFRTAGSVRDQVRSQLDLGVPLTAVTVPGHSRTV